jgi:hypothetical protein
MGMARIVLINAETDVHAYRVLGFRATIDQSAV